MYDAHEAARILFNENIMKLPNQPVMRVDVPNVNGIIYAKAAVEKAIENLTKVSNLDLEN